MQFPISRARLQNYRKSEACIAARSARIEESMKTICKGVENTLLCSDERKYIHRITIFEKYGRPQYVNGTISMGSIVNELIEMAKIMFPDSKITLDPLESYIMIDWS
jgi:hypothetical protein